MSLTVEKRPLRSDRAVELASLADRTRTFCWGPHSSLLPADLLAFHDVNFSSGCISHLAVLGPWRVYGDHSRVRWRSLTLVREAQCVCSFSVSLSAYLMLKQTITQLTRVTLFLVVELAVKVQTESCRPCSSPRPWLAWVISVFFCVKCMLAVVTHIVNGMEEQDISTVKHQAVLACFHWMMKNYTCTLETNK